ncbi:DUF4870 domain-containing protein [Halanaeroarchaeum sulfurireducens]|uniref:Uncharacterized protein n=1 Tax=Halanaeroarchaeum sulfurireducens TaxID=1604004 RepID=A0A0F7PFK3_9EURY|nr:DUF4870 domain-containing protein [Halanaeroarchaeum sulfurireducens]AKH98098.1 hypothetical protein HLASF_1621 [Halanaeroarchaeum sulfurireducens]ALG82492.1 hypothetical protein HLASA_1608 [Halanaeroarchaeum sulfurireducens]
MATTSADEADRTTSTGETSLGLEENLGAALAYVLGFLTGIIVFLLEQENDHVRFHAAQSMVVFGGIFVVSIILSILGGGLSTMMAGGAGSFVATGLSLILGLASMVLWLASLVLWVYLLVRTYQGSDPRIPVAAGIADGLV